MDKNFAVEFPFPHYPAAGKTIEVLPGIHWLSSPLPFRLKAINLYLLKDGDGWVIVDCGYSAPVVRAQWEDVWAATLGGRPVKRLIVTHFHPDHIGNSKWLSERWQLRPWITQAEWLTGQSALHGVNGGSLDDRLKFYVENGLDGTLQSLFRTEAVPYSAGAQLPGAYNRLFDGDEIVINGRVWRVIVGRGHSPEHACLYCEELKAFVAGDQLLPEITTNISVWADEPGADPLGLFLDSLKRLKQELSPETLVLPAHRRPFLGVRERIAELEFHHQERLQKVIDAAAGGPVTAGDLLPVLFTPGLDGHQVGFAMGEALAHLNYLARRGILREYQADGRNLFAAK